jgi:phage gp36-like protein
MSQPYLTYSQWQGLAPPALSAQSSGVVTPIILDQSSVMDGYFGKRYVLPLVTFDVDVSVKCADLVNWKLATQIGFKPSSGNNEVLLINYQSAERWLENVSKGLVVLSNVTVDSSSGNIGEEGPQAASDNRVNFQRAGVTGNGWRWGNRW